MKKEILINHTPEETRIALLEEAKLAEFFVERPKAGEASLKKIVGNIYLGKVENILPGIQSAFVNIGLKKNAYLPLDETLPVEGKRSIEERLKKGQNLLLQITKEPIGDKGAKVSERISLAGRFLVYLPLDRRQIFLSQQIKDKKEGQRLKKITQELPLSGGGLILRTEAEGVEKKQLLTDLEYLTHLWNAIQIKRKEKVAPALIHEEVGLVYQVLRDLFSEEVGIVLVDSPPLCQEVLNYIGIISPELKSRVQHYTQKTPIFTAHNLEEEIKRIYRPKVKLPSGGYIIIQETESLCAIDVNSGKFTGSPHKGGRSSPENTALQTNLEAAKEIARQLRLRNIGGIIVIDFIGLNKTANQRRVYDILVNALKPDKAKIEVLPFNRLGLIELTRERKRESMLNLLTDECPECLGSGRIISSESMYLKIKKELANFKGSLHGSRLRLRLHPDLFSYLERYKEELHKMLGIHIEFVQDLHLKRDDYQIVLSASGEKS